METIRLSDTGAEAAAVKAAAVLRAGGVILYPTDTLYGLGADALSDKALLKVQKIKGRDEKKPVHAIIADLAMAERYAVLNENALALARAFWPGPLTLVLEKKQGMETGIGRDIKTVGIRIPDNKFCLALAQEFGKPYTGTSANKSGEEPKRSIPAILEQLGKVAENIDLVIDAGDRPAGGAARLPSTVVDIHAGRPVILREGAILSKEIWNVLRAEP